MGIHFITSCGHWRFGWSAATTEHHLISSCNHVCEFLFIVMPFPQHRVQAEALPCLLRAGSQFAQDEFLHYRAQFALSGINCKLPKDHSCSPIRLRIVSVQ